MPNQLLAQESLFLALGDPTRLAVVQRLCQGPQTVTQLAEPFKMALPSFLQHVQLLEKSGWVQSTKKGRVRTCTINPAALKRTEHWLDERRQQWEKRLDQLDDFLLKTKTEE